MKKMNNKGFLLVETIIVASFVVTVLVILFLQFKNLIISYNNSYKYNTVEGIYNLNAIKKCILQNQENNPLDKSIPSDKGYISLNIDDLSDDYISCGKLIGESEIKNIIYIKNNNLETVKNQNFSSGLKNFIKYLQANTLKQNRLIAEFKDSTFASISFNNSSSLFNTSYLVSNDTSANGYDKTFPTIQDAYNAVPLDGVNIYISSDINLTETLNFNDNKKINIISSKRNEKFKITKAAGKSTINISNGELNLYNIILEGAQSGGALINTPDNSTAKITINNVTMQNNTSNTNGSALYLKGNTNVIINDGNIINNKAPSGGAIDIAKGSSVTLNSGTINENEVTGNGGAINNAGTFNINGGEIGKNIANNGGGIYSSGENGALNINGGTIEENQANNGAGIYLLKKQANLKGGEILSNEASNYGGGVYINNATLKMTRGIIDSNIAKQGGGIYILHQYNGTVLKSHFRLEGTGTGTSSESQITNNTAKDSNGGGGIYIQGGSNNTTIDDPIVHYFRPENISSGKNTPYCIGNTSDRAPQDLNNYCEWKNN